MITKEQLMMSSSFAILTNAKGVLTTKEANDRSLRVKTIITISSLKHNVFFFSDDHCFGVRIPEMKLAGFIPSTAVMPHPIRARPAVPDGMIKDAETYREIFCSGYGPENKPQRQLNSVEELADFLNTIE